MKTKKQHNSIGEQTVWHDLTIAEFTNENRIQLFFKGMFSFSNKDLFLTKLNSIMENDIIDHILIDLDGVQNIDSAAIGFLLLLNEKAHHLHKEVSYRYKNKFINEVFAICDLHQKLLQAKRKPRGTKKVKEVKFEDSKQKDNDSFVKFY